MPKVKYKLASPLLMWTLVILGAIVLWYLVPHGRLFAGGILGIIIFILGLVNWLYVSFVAVKVHPKAPTSVANIDQLITEGVYSIVRHPLYVADIVLGLSIFILDPLYKIMAIVIWLIAVLIFWANLEERMLEEKFLEDYRNYKKQVPMLVPNIWKKKA